MFTGFNIKFPEYEVITPQTKKSFTVRSLTVQEEEKLKGSLVTPGKILDHLNTCIYECIVKKPDTCKDYNSFLKNVTIKDRDALLYGLYHITYDDIRNYDITCTSCGNKHPVTVKASDTFNYNEYPGDSSILERVIPLPLPVTKGVTAYIKQPTLEDEIKLTKEVAGLTDASTESLIILKFEQDDAQQKKPISYEQRNEILEGYLQLLPRDRKEIHKVYLENFGKYGIELKMKAECPKCGFSEVTNIDLVESFFRNVLSI